MLVKAKIQECTWPHFFSSSLPAIRVFSLIVLYKTHILRWFFYSLCRICSYWKINSRFLIIYVVQCHRYLDKLEKHQKFPFSTFIYHHIMHAPITEKSKYIFGNHFCLSTFMSSAWVIHKSVGYFLLTPFDLVWWNQFHPYVCLLEIYLSFPQMDMSYIWCVRENFSSTSPGKLKQLLTMLTDINRFSKQKTIVNYS